MKILNDLFKSVKSGIRLALHVGQSVTHAPPVFVATTKLPI